MRYSFGFLVCAIVLSWGFVKAVFFAERQIKDDADELQRIFPGMDRQSAELSAAIHREEFMAERMLYAAIAWGTFSAVFLSEA